MDNSVAAKQQAGNSLKVTIIEDALEDLPFRQTRHFGEAGQVSRKPQNADAGRYNLEFQVARRSRIDNSDFSF